MVIRVDWSRRMEYVRARHGVLAAWADEALADPDAYWLDPDPTSISGTSARVIGYSSSAAMLLTVVLLHPEVDPDESPDGEWWGANAWPSNTHDQHIYREQS